VYKRKTGRSHSAAAAVATIRHPGDNDTTFTVENPQKEQQAVHEQQTAFCRCTLITTEKTLRCVAFNQINDTRFPIDC